MADKGQEKERDGLAAEYALGTLSTAERTEAERLLRTDPGFARSVAAWEQRLYPLADATGDAEAPPDALGEIEARLDTLEPDAEARIAVLERRTRYWRRMAIGFGAVAASIFAIVALNEYAAQPRESFVAVLEGEDAPAFVAAVNLAERTISVIRIEGSQPAPAGSSLELWAIGGGRAAPESLGLIGDEARLSARTLAQSDPGGTTFAISVEPEGGSPTGQPTGPVVYTGRLVPLPEH